MNVYYSEAHALHNPAFEIFDGGERIASFEVPQRMERILVALRQDGRFEILPPEEFGLQPIRAVHDESYLHFLQNAYQEWLATPLDADYERNALLPATFPPAGWRGHIPKSILGRAGYYMMDLSAPIGAGTWQAALASAYCALSGAKFLAQANILSPAAFALCRPPGHHAGRAYCGGYCYINNAAVAAHWLTQFGKVALLDVDYHAGNGTQDIFYQRADVLTLSLHADPDYEYPYYSGYADEIGTGTGWGYHRNFPLSIGTDDESYLAVLQEALQMIRAYAPQFLVISAGMDVYGEDPLGKIRLSTGGIARLGEYIAALSLPTLIVMEGGYNTAALGQNIVSFLEAFHAR
ncbi:MAG: acetylpolyamine amidohydrolase [Anaerolineae bacterium]|nr:MAG: acetylpolyamine amidohydrolase [Anaerolineae bacterium]